MWGKYSAMSQENWKLHSSYLFKGKRHWFSSGSKSKTRDGRYNLKLKVSQA